jgi:DNA-binding transcriptional LysR family regulator
VELRHLAALTAVAREGSFRGAADSLGYVQSAVSQQIAQLEQLVGARLLERARGSRRIRVTPPGELLVEHAEQILARMHAARADLSFHPSGHGREWLRVGVFPGVAATLLPEVLRAVGAPEPAVDPVEAAGDAALLELLERGELDLTFAELPLPAGPFESRAILCDPCALLVAVDSEWAARTRAPSIEELASGTLVALGEARSTEALETWFAAHGVAPRSVLSAGNESTLRAWVAAGLAVAIVPRLSVEPWDPRILAVDLEGLVPGRRVALVWHSERLYGGTLEAFCETAARVARDLADRGRAGKDEEARRLELSAA